MANKNAKVSIFEIVWYTLCVLVILWGITYVVLSTINKYNDLSSLKEFATNFKKTFGLSLFFWGLIIIAIGAVAMSAVMIIFAKTFDRAADREQRRSARLSAIKKDQQEKVVAEQKPEVVEQPAPEVEEKPEPEQPVEEPVQEEAQPEEKPAEEPAEEMPTEAQAEQEPQPEEAPADEAAPEAEEQPVEEEKPEEPKAE